MDVLSTKIYKYSIAAPKPHKKNVYPDNIVNKGKPFGDKLPSNPPHFNFNDSNTFLNLILKKSPLSKF